MRRCETFAKGHARLMDAEETARVVGTSHYRGAFRDDRAGTVQPLAYVRGLARAAMSKGATIHTGTKVVAAERTGERWSLRTDAGSVRCEHVIVATNAHSGDLWPGLRDEIIPQPYFQFAMRPLGDNLRRSVLPNREGAGDTRKVVNAFRGDASGRLVFGSVGVLGRGAASLHRSYARRALRRLFPMLGDVEFEAEWYGWIAMTRDHIPHYRELAPRVLNFNGYNGRGIGTGTAFGKLLAQRILDPAQEMPLPARQPEGVRFRTARSAWYEAGAAAAHVN